MPMGGIAIGMAGASLAGGVMSYMASQDALDAFKQATDEALGYLNAVPQPPDRTAAILIEKYRQAGILTPEMEKKIKLDASKMMQVQEDPKLRQKQAQGLEILQTLSKTGLGAEDRAAYNQLRAQTQQDAEAKRQQILQNMAARGMAGSGNELIASLNASQAATNQASQQGDQIAADSAARRMAALQAMITGAGSVRGQDFSVNSEKAKAADANSLVQFNEAVARQSRNVGSGNEAQRLNLAQAQAVSTGNTDAGNRELYRQDQARQDLWNSQMQLAQAKAAARTGAAGGMLGAQQSQAQGWQTMGTGVANAIGAYGTFKNNQNQPYNNFNNNQSSMNWSSGNSTSLPANNTNYGGRA